MGTVSDIYLTPRAIIAGSLGHEAVAAGWAWPLLGDWGAFAALEITTRQGRSFTRAVMLRSKSAPDANIPTLEAFAHARPAFAGLGMNQPRIMGILNVTPDSFSDGGAFATAGAAVAHGIALLKAGADIIDVGGESTRPGAVPVDAAEDARRVLPIIKALASRGACVSVDTRHATVMTAAIESGARIVNDVTALSGDPAALSVIARSHAAVVLMHMQGDPRTMQANPTYDWAPGDVFGMLRQRVQVCVEAGIGLDRIAVDPGIGFGKTATHSAAVLDHIAMYHGLGCVVAVGGSRKSFIGTLSRGEGVEERLPGSLAVALHAVAQGVQIVRVHDIAETRQAIAVAGHLAGRA